MIFAVTQAQKDFIERVARGEKVVWHHGMSILAVFADDFDADAMRPNWVAYPLTSLHYVDLLRSFGTEHKPSRIMGVEFWSAKPILDRVHASGKVPSEWTAGLFLEKCLEYTSADRERLKKGIEELIPVVGHIVIPEEVIFKILEPSIQ